MINTNDDLAQFTSKSEIEVALKYKVKDFNASAVLVARGVTNIKNVRSFYIIYSYTLSGVRGSG